MVESPEINCNTFRACDNCIAKQARWYCAADDAFLCQTCDSSVHSANSLARRHVRVRLKTSSFKPSSKNSSVSSWFTRKARTPRTGKVKNPFSQVPELSSKEEISRTEEEQMLLHVVPVLGSDSKAGFVGEKENLNGFLSYVMDCGEFSADVECLLGNRLDNECFDIEEELGLTPEKEDYCLNSDKVIKMERNEREESAMTEPFELNFDELCCNPTSFGEEDEKVGVMAVVNNGEFEMENKRNKALLSLDREAVVMAWGSRGTPWTGGDLPNFDVDCYSPDCLGTCWSGYFHQFGEMSGGMSRTRVAGAEGEREARVLRYREKRRTRLFAKKIRYEVRKLNAEKRPRMKGRFVKRSSCSVPPPLPLFHQ